VRTGSERIAGSAQLVWVMHPAHSAYTVTPDDALLLAATVTVPQHVVYRSFPTETVVLNLQTGKYHGLNATAGRMLQELERAASVADAICALEQIYDELREVLERDVCELCRSLLQCGLIEVQGGPAD
jgi:hypothetical protein